MEPLIHYVSLDNVLSEPDALVALCGGSGDWTTKESLVTCPSCRKLIGPSRAMPRPRGGGGQLDLAEET